MRGQTGSEVGNPNDNTAIKPVVRVESGEELDYDYLHYWTWFGLRSFFFFQIDVVFVLQMSYFLVYPSQETLQFYHNVLSPSFLVLSSTAAAVMYTEHSQLNPDTW